jgi:pyruvate/2-oxoglutarate dehydrogenase complex dihydrolipoamide acyltransferase (E2) component
LLRARDMKSNERDVHLRTAKKDRILHVALRAHSKAKQEQKQKQFRMQAPEAASTP